MSERETTEIEPMDHARIDEREHDFEPEQREHHDSDDGPRPKSPRDLAMEAIAARRIDAINRELVIGEEMADAARHDAGFEPLERERDEHGRFRSREQERDHDDDVQPEDLAEDPEIAQRRETKQTTPNLRTMEIDGNVYSVTDEQYAQLASLGARTNVALSQHQQHVQDQGPRHSQQAHQQAAQQQAYIDALNDADAAAVADRLLYGGKEDVAATLKQLSNHLVQRTRQEQQALYQQQMAQQRADAEQKDVESALMQISEEFPDIMHDRVLGELAAVQLGHVRQECQALGRSVSNLESYREACQRVRSVLGTSDANRSVNRPNAQASVRTSSRESDRSEVMSRKRAAPSQPAATGRRGSQSAVAAGPSPSEIVASMRKARHQSSYT